MVMAADIQPGMTVVEAGAGSGALSIALLQALAPGGRLHAFERRPDFADQARRNVERWFGKTPTASSCTPATWSKGWPTSRPVDRVLLDLLEPWLVVPGAARGPTPWRGAGLLRGHRAPGHAPGRGVCVLEPLRPGGDLGGHLPPWHVDGLAVRPEHRT